MEYRKDCTEFAAEAGAEYDPGTSYDADPGMEKDKMENEDRGIEAGTEYDTGTEYGIEPETAYDRGVEYGTELETA